jgi:hypothetical protein
MLCWYKRQGDDKLPTKKQDQLARYYATCNHGDLEAPPLPILPDRADLEPPPLPNLPSPECNDRTDLKPPPLPNLPLPDCSDREQHSNDEWELQYFLQTVFIKTNKTLQQFKSLTMREFVVKNVVVIVVNVKSTVSNYCKMKNQ